MKKYTALLSGVAMAALAATAWAQIVSLPLVTAINPGVDLVQIIPAGVPATTNVYATVAQLRSGSTDGISAQPYRLLDFKNANGTTLSATAGAGVFGIAITAGTSEWLVSEAANSNTKTDTASFEYILPASYVAGQNITLTANTQYNVGSGTVGTHTVAAAAYLTSAAGTQGSSLIATSAQTVPAAAGNVAFTITGTTLTPGSRLFLTFTLVISESAGSNITAQLNSVTPS